MTSAPTGKEIMQAEARRRFFEAMEEVQIAQNHLDRASGLLMHVASGGSPAERRIWKERERVHALWYWLEGFIRGPRGKKITLDGIVGPRFLDDLAKQTPEAIDEIGANGEAAKGGAE